jgi:excisionase family DNA binding protein
MGRMPLPDLPDLGEHNHRRVLTRAEAAKFLSVSVPTLERWAKEGRGPKTVQLGVRRLGYRLDQLISFLDQPRAV